MAEPARGLLMGNRGCLHGSDRRLRVSRWRSKLWICCLLDWKDRQRDPMPPDRWTALFFLDEATALSAGHRPCGYCRRADYLAFAEAWRAAQGLAERPRAVAMDARLHAERVESRSRRQRTRPARAGDLPDGVLVRLHGTTGSPTTGLSTTQLPTTPSGSPTTGSPTTGPPTSGPPTTGLLLGGHLLPWSFAGYAAPMPLPPATPVELLTPPATAAAIAAGYRPLLHPTAAAAPSSSPPRLLGPPEHARNP